MDYIHFGKNEYGGEDHAYDLHVERNGLVLMFKMSAADFAELNRKMLETTGAVGMRAEDIGLPPSENDEDLPF